MNKKGNYNGCLFFYNLAYMELKKEFIGGKTYSKLMGTQIEINEENINILLHDCRWDLFVSDIERVPLVKKETVIEPKQVIHDKKKIFDALCIGALKGFQNRDPKEIKKQFEIVGIPFDKKTSLKKLAETIKNLPHDFVVK